MAETKDPKAVAVPQAGNALQQGFAPQNEAAQTQALQFNQQQQAVVQAQAKQQLYQLVASIDSLLSSFNTPSVNTSSSARTALHPAALGGTNGAYGLNTLNYPSSVSNGALSGFPQGPSNLGSLYSQVLAPQSTRWTNPLSAGGGLTL